MSALAVWGIAFGAVTFGTLCGLMLAGLLQAGRDVELGPLYRCTCGWCGPLERMPAFRKCPDCKGVAVHDANARQDAADRWRLELDRLEARRRELEHAPASSLCSCGVGPDVPDHLPGCAKWPGAAS